MLGPASRLHFGIDRARDLVAREQVGRAPVVLLVLVPGVRLALGVRGVTAEELGDVLEHEALALAVLQGAAVAPDSLRHQDPPHRERPDHRGRVELGHLHVDEIGAGLERHRNPIAGVLPRVRRDLPRFSDAAGREHDGLRAEGDELAGLPPVADRAGHALAVV